MKNDHEPGEKVFFATPKQIKDWYNYARNDNVWISRSIAVAEADPEKVRLAYEQVLHKHAITRSLFAVNERGTIIRKVLPPDHPFFGVQIWVYQTAAELREIEEGFVREVLQRKLADGATPLFHVNLYVGPSAGGLVRVFVHHLICNGSSFEKLFRDLAGYYHDPGRPVRPAYQFEDYAQYNFNRLTSGFERDYAFLKAYFGAVNPRIVRPAKAYYRWDEARFAEALSREKYAVSESHREPGPPAAGKEIFKVLRLPDYPEVREEMIRQNLFWSSLVYGCFARVMQQFMPPEKQFFGFLADDCYTPYSSSTVGDFTGDLFFNCRLAGEPTPEGLARVQAHVQELYQHPIFNYNLYSIDEAELFGMSCGAFLNFNVVEGDFDREAFVLDVFRQVPVPGLNLQPDIWLYADGHLLVRWKCSGPAYPEATILAMNRAWQEHVVRACGHVLTAVPEPGHP